MEKSIEFYTQTKNIINADLNRYLIVTSKFLFDSNKFYLVPIYFKVATRDCKISGGFQTKKYLKFRSKILTPYLRDNF